MKEKGNRTRGRGGAARLPTVLRRKQNVLTSPQDETVAVRATRYYQRIVAPFANSSNGRPLSTVVSRPPLCSILYAQCSFLLPESPVGKALFSPTDKYRNRGIEKFSAFICKVEIFGTYLEQKVICCFSDVHTELGVLYSFS